MPILTVQHVTTYRYRTPVTFGEHRMMLRPRDDRDQRVLDTTLEITPQPIELSWAQDRFGNYIATAHFAHCADELPFESAICLDHTPVDFRVCDIAEHARGHPFSYPEQEKIALAPFLVPTAPHLEVSRWVAGFLDRDGSADTAELLCDMTQTMKETFKHAARHEHGIQDPLYTLTTKSGSCRDLAVLMITCLRSLSIAARFVSGYLHLADDDDDGCETGGNTHAWVQAYVPGLGWVDLDPSGGTVGNRNLVRVAVVSDPREAIPLQGTWIGEVSDHLAMQVAVRVRAMDR